MQYNVYFRKHNWERFKEEPEKAELINKLLEKHYGPDAQTVANEAFAGKDCGHEVCPRTCPNYLAL